MNAFHINWTKPFFVHEGHGAYNIEDFEILTTILSALEWQRLNGDIKMYTDEIGAEYYHNLGIEHIWNLGIDTTLQNEVCNEIDPANFWAAGKVYALRKQNTPCVMMDTDFIVFKPIKDRLKDEQLVVFHKEEIHESGYPDKSYFKMSENYQFPTEWDWTVDACNTSLMYISNESFKDYYTDQSIQFMKNLRGEYNRIKYMIFAEQRVLAMCAEKQGIPIKALQDLRNVDKETRETFFHVWRYKNVLRSDSSKRGIFCTECIKKLFQFYPHMKETLLKIKCLEPYCKKVI